MAMFHVVLTRSGPSYQYGLALEEETGWTEHALQVESVEPWTVRLNGRNR